MKILRLTLLLLVTPFLSYAQNQAVRLPDFPESRYQGGAEAFYEYLGQNLKYPSQARGNGRVGTAIVTFTILPEGDFTNFKIVNPLGKGIDENIRDVFSEIENKWLPEANALPASIYLPITYTINGKTFLRLPPSEDKFISEIVVNAMGSSRSQKHSREQLIERVYKFIEKKKHKKALRYADELIRRDPLNKQWYVVRSSIYKEMGETESVCSELTKIRDFLEYPVADKLLQQYCR